MEKSLTSIPTNEIYVTHAEYKQGFIKIWANVYTKKRSNMEKCLQDYTSFSKEFNKLDLYGHSMYIYVWKTNVDHRVYRCHVLQTDLVNKMHTIVLLDYGQQLVTPYCNVREVTKDLDITIINSLSQRPLLETFFLSEYISKEKPNNDLSSILCNKYYKYIINFFVGDMKFVTLFDIDKKRLVESNLAICVTVEAMYAIANSNTSLIQSMNSNDSLNSISISNKTAVSFLRYQSLDYVTPIDVAITSVDTDKTSILLTVRILDHDSEAINKILNSLNRHDLRLAPVIDVYTPCLIVLRNKLVRAIILEVKIDRLFIALVDYGIRETIPRTAVFEVPPKCDLIEMRSLNVVLDKPKGIIINENMFAQKYFQMLPLKMDPNYGLYKVQLLKKINGNLIDVFNDMSINENCLKPSQSPELFSITEIQDEIESLENVLVTNTTNTMSSNYSSNNEIEKKNVELMENKSINLKETETVDQIQKPLTIDYNNIEKKSVELIENKNVNLKETETVSQIENPIAINRIIPIFFLRKDSLNDDREIVGSLIYYKSPFNFRIRQYNPNFEPFMNQIKSNLNSRDILTQNELVKNMYVIYQKKQSDILYRSQIIDLDSEIEKITFQLIDEGDEIINEHFSKITLYNFNESDSSLPGQLVLDCALNNMWFPVMDIDTIFLLQPYFSKRQLYKVLIVETNECGVKLVQMFLNDINNVDISDIILESGIGQRLSAAMKTDECPYEENLLKGQSFLSYIYDYHFKMCIQPEPNTVDELQEEIQEYISKNSNPEPLDVCSLKHIKYCLATISDNQWHRACIKIFNEDSITVNMFDIGLITDVSYEQIQPITNDLMRKPQLCLNCYLETKDMTFKLTEKVLYNVTVKSVDADGKLCITVKEHNTVPLFSPIVRSIEKISFVHVDGDLTYLQRSQDKLKIQKLSETLSKMNGKLESKSIAPGDMAIFESHGMYYRCVVKSINSKMVVAYCIDFGYEKQVEKKKLQFLGHSKIALLPALVTVVKTFPMAFNMKTMFIAHMGVDHDGTLNAMPSRMSSIQTQNKLMETLQKECLVKVSCVNSSDECWIVPHLFLDRLKIISDVLIKMQSKIIPTVTEIGSLCAAQNTETKKWHRALLLDSDESIKNVLLIDSGEKIKVRNTTKLTGEVQKIPNCALRCKVSSSIPIKNLLNKDVKCQLISCNQSLLKIELFADVKEIISTQSGKEWTVVVCKYESLNKFYVRKIIKKTRSANIKSNSLLTSVANNSKDLMHQPQIGSIIETLTDRGDSIWYKAEIVAPYDSANFIVRLLDDGSICKSTKIKDISVNDEKLIYRCCLEDYSDDDELTSDPNNFDFLSKVMMSYEWTMKTMSDKEPFKVNLTLNGLDCIDVLYKLMHDSYNEYIGKVSESMSDQYESSIDELINKDSSLVENPKNQIVKDNNTASDLTFPSIEIVTIKDVETHKCFYAKSESLFTLYMERINSEMDMCVVQLPMNSDMIGSIVVVDSESLQRWCRARVNEISPNGTATCYLLDDGVYDICIKFYKPTDFLMACPPIVRCCSLYTPKLAGKEDEIWFPDVDDMFKDIISIEGIKFDMIIKEDRVYPELFVVTLMLENADVSEMLVPINVRVSYINSLTDFKIKAVSEELITVTKTLKSNSFRKVIVENPVIDKIYLAYYKNKLLRVKYDGQGGLKYVVVDIDDTLDNLSVDKLFEIPECISNIPPFTMPCSLILHDKQEMYSEELFRSLADDKVVFVMCIITESDSKQPNFVKLYHDDQDVLSIIKLK